MATFAPLCIYSYQFYSYATAQDEFEIASESTAENRVYAQEDRDAAREELEKFKAAFEKAVRGASGDEIQRRVGQRLRELEAAILDMEKRAMEE